MEIAQPVSASEPDIHSQWAEVLWRLGQWICDLGGGERLGRGLHVQAGEKR